MKGIPLPDYWQDLTPEQQQRWQQIALVKMGQGDYTPIDKHTIIGRSGIRKIGHAVKSIVQTQLSDEHLRSEAEQTRIKLICLNNCPGEKAIVRNGQPVRCDASKGGCGCVLRFKIRDKRESCPDGCW